MRDLLRLLRVFRPYWGWIALGVLLSFATLLANVGLMAISGWFITAMALAGVAGVSMNYFTPAAIIRFFAIVRTVGRYLERLVTHEATFRMLATLRSWFYEHLEPLAPARLQHFRSGDLLSRIRADIDTLENFYLGILAPLLVAFFGSIAFIFFLGSFHPLMGLIELVLLLFAGVLIPTIIAKLASAPGKRKVQTASELRATTVDGLQGMGELLVYGAAENHAQQMNALSKKLIRDQGQLARFTGISQGVMIFSANLAMISILIIAVVMVNQEHLSPAYLTMLALFALASFEAILPLPLAFQSLGETLAAARRIFSIVDTEPEVKEPAEEPAAPDACSIHLQGISFRYERGDTEALHDISFDLPPGKKLAIVGPTGSGKSTLIDLLLRFREPSAGQIEFAGHPLEAWTGDTVRQKIAVVSQRTHLFNSTIRNNLMLANLEADTTEMEAACRIAQIHDFIQSQPQGYDTFVGEAGVKLSGGQARRIAIARAVLKDAPILVLDEPGEGLDAPTERATMQALFDYLGDRSLLLITHRITGLDAVDEILVLENGQIIERGNHVDLLKTGQRYRNLFENFGNLD